MNAMEVINKLIPLINLQTQHQKQKLQTSASVIEKVHNPNSADIALPLDAFPVQSRCREVENINDLEACEHQHFHFCSGAKNKNKHAPQHPSLAETNSD